MKNTEGVSSTTKCWIPFNIPVNLLLKNLQSGNLATYPNICVTLPSYPARNFAAYFQAVFSEPLLF